MQRQSKSAKTESRLPSREDLVAFLSKAPGKVGKREIARAFDIRGGDRIWLKQMLADLEAEGVVDRRRKTVHKAGRLRRVVAADGKGRAGVGELAADPGDWDADESGPAPKILVPMPRKPRPGQPV